jgi:hypothetical protein
VVVAAARQLVPANVLLAIASLEGGRNGQVVCNANGSCDISHFQINSNTWRTELAPWGVRIEDLRWRGCYNAEVAAFLLHRDLSEKSGDFWTKAANYHSRTPQFNAPYRAALEAFAARWARWLVQQFPTVHITYR